MARRSTAALLAALSIACGGLAGPEDAGKSSGARASAIRIATYNVEGIGRPGSREWTALVAVLRRIDADLVLLQEITEDDGPRRFRRLAEAASYPYRALSRVHGTLSGGLRVGCLSRRPILAQRSWSAAALSGDPRANDIGRDLLACRIAAPWGELLAVTLHFKAGPGAANAFRRAVEAARLGRLLDRSAGDRAPIPVVVAGDFNADPRFERREHGRFDGPPPDLPPTFRIGPGIDWPIPANVFAPLERRGFRALPASLEDEPADRVTHPPTGRRIDLIWIGPRLRSTGAVVYEGCRDDGIDDPPPGAFLPFAGTPLRCDATRRAADHRPVVADLVPRRPAGWSAAGAILPARSGR